MAIQLALNFPPFVHLISQMQVYQIKFWGEPRSCAHSQGLCNLKMTTTTLLRLQ